MRESGSMIRPTDRESTPMLMEPGMKDLGLKTNKRVKVKKSGLMVLDTKETISRENNMEEVNFSGQTGLNMKENSKTTI